jgi:hypothetical protein
VKLLPSQDEVRGGYRSSATPPPQSRIDEATSCPAPGLDPVATQASSHEGSDACPRNHRLTCHGRQAAVPPPSVLSFCQVGLHVCVCVSSVQIRIRSRGAVLRLSTRMRGPCYYPGHPGKPRDKQERPDDWRVATLQRNGRSRPGEAPPTGRWFLVSGAIWTSSRRRVGVQSPSRSTVAIARGCPLAARSRSTRAQGSKLMPARLAR